MSIPEGAPPAKPSLKAVIFDVDGVLVQSMEKHHLAYQHAFAKHGIDIAPQEVFANEGRRSREVIVSLAKERGLDLSEQEVDRMNAAKQAYFASFGALPRYPRVDDLVTRLRARGARLAIVTGTSRENIERHFGAFLDNFEAIVTADDVTHTKPHPEPYLAALSKLDLSAEACIIIENAPLGIRSGKAAGVRVLGVTSTNPAEALKDADAIVPSVADTWFILARLLA